MAVGVPSPAAGSDTIFAVASGYGRAAISVIRLSGPASKPVLSALTAGRVPVPRMAALRRLREPATGERLDQAICLWMPGPATFTGEDQAELHVHGGVAVRAALLRVLADQDGCRAAEPGEFTRRAFLNGRIDLTGVEGLADLIDSETEAQRRQAVRQLEGELSGRVTIWRDRLRDALASCEALLDFSDEDDVPASVTGEVGSVVTSVRSEILAALAGARRGERVRDGVTVVIAGPPNAGKSTLLNAIARRDVAIVSPAPGTTRDAIEVRCDLDGLPVVFVDTAGLRETSDTVEQQGIARTRARIGEADLVLWLHPADGPGSAIGPDMPAAARLVITKSDLGTAPLPSIGSIAVSARTGAGLSDLLDEVRRGAETLAGRGDVLLTRERHRVLLTDAVSCLNRAEASLSDPDATELLAEDLRLALRALGRMVGAVDAEEVLGRIFESFCIGK